MEHSIDIIDKENAKKVICIINRDHLITRSAKVMIKFPLNNDEESDTDEDYEDNCDIVNDEVKNDLAGNDDIKDGEEEPSPGDSLTDFPIYKGQTERNDLLFYGVVKDDNNYPIEGAAVMIFACYGEAETPLGYTFTDKEGTYMINLPEPLDYNKLEGFKVCAGKCSRPADRKTRPAVNPGKETYTRSINRDVFDFFKFLSRNPNKTLTELMKRF